MTGMADALSALDPSARERLARFAARFERLDASSYATFTESVETDEVLAAKARAVEVLGAGRRRDAVRAAVKSFTDEAASAYSRRMSLPDTLLLFQSLPDRAGDRMRFLASVERVVVALALWDDLDADDQGALLGPWADVVDPLLDEDEAG